MSLGRIPKPSWSFLRSSDKACSGFGFWSSRRLALRNPVPCSVAFRSCFVGDEFLESLEAVDEAYDGVDGARENASESSSVAVVAGSGPEEWPASEAVIDTDCNRDAGTDPDAEGVGRRGLRPSSSMDIGSMLLLRLFLHVSSLLSFVRFRGRSEQA